jgi:hypothetical protein
LASAWLQEPHGVGLRGITAIDPDRTATVVVAGEPDAHRNHRQRFIDRWGDLDAET